MNSTIHRTVVSICAGFALFSAWGAPANAQCGSRSPLACAAVPVSIPYQLNWAASEGAIAAGNALGTGFTVVEPHTINLDPLVPSNVSLNGYEPSMLAVDTSAGGSLKITTSRGIMYRDPANASAPPTNSLVNGLGVGVPLSSEPLRMETVLSSLPAANNQAEQGGLWFWLNEDNLVKLAAISTNVGTSYRFQLQVEDYAPTAVGFPNPAMTAPLEINTGSFNLAAGTAKLILVVEPATSKFTASYDIGSGPVVIGSFPQASNAAGTTSTCPSGICPTPGAEFFAGVNHDANGGTPNVHLAGLFATQRQNTTITPRKVYTFDSFRVGESCTTGADCTDGTVCNGVETCVANICQPGTPLNCDDGNVCDGTDTCSPTLGCQDGTPLNCDDGNVCDGTDTCSPTLGCQDGTPLNCDDGNVCDGTDTCSPTLGCQDGTPLNCVDSNLCNGAETCSPTLGCQAGTPLTCVDSNLCNGAETCVPATGCQAGTPLTCNDSNACNGVETCVPATGCQAGTPLTCTDSNPCTTNSCIPASGCSVVNNTIPCDDGNACTSSDVCGGGTCSGTGVPLCCTPVNTVQLDTMVKKTVLKLKADAGGDKLIAKGAFVSAGVFNPADVAVSLGITDSAGSLYEGSIVTGSFVANGTKFQFKDSTAPYEQGGVYISRLKVLGDNATVKYLFKARGLDLPTPDTGVGSLVIKVGDKCYVDGNHVCSGTASIAKCQ